MKAAAVVREASLRKSLRGVREVGAVFMVGAASMMPERAGISLAYLYR